MPEYMKKIILDRSWSNTKEREELNNEFPVKRQKMILEAIKRRNVFLALVKQFIQKG